jgi:hypothetical protein
VRIIRRETRLAERALVVLAGVLSVSLPGCPRALERPSPSRDGFIADYLEYFDQSHLEKLDYEYKGAIGGAFTVGRAQFKGPVKLRDGLVEVRTKAGKFTVGTYDPTRMTEQEKWAFNHQWTLATDGKMPSWLDFPFNRKMRTLREASEGSTRDARPRYEKEWYIDDEKNVVYIQGNWG